MFDLGFSELFLIALVALVVLGPERLPKAARFAGVWIKRARSQWQSVKSEFENQLADEELSGSLRATRDELHDVRKRLREQGESLRNEFEPGDQDHPEYDDPEFDSEPELDSASDPELRAMLESSDESDSNPPEPEEPGLDEPERREPRPGEPERREPGRPEPTRRDPPPDKPGEPAPDQRLDDESVTESIEPPARDRDDHDRR